MSTQPASGDTSPRDTAQTANTAQTENAPTDTAQDAAPQEAHLDTELKSIIADVLGIDAEQADALNEESGLFGHLPELDSMAVAGLLTEMEDRLDIVIEDDDVDGEMLETYGGLLAFAQTKITEG